MKIIISLIIFFSFLVANNSFAQLYDLEEDLFFSDSKVKGIYDIERDTGLSDSDPRAISANVINIILGFLGIIAVMLVLAGGFMWMVSGGNEDKTTQAKKLLTSGVIGLIIILAAFGIAKFLVNALIVATG